MVILTFIVHCCFWAKFLQNWSDFTLPVLILKLLKPPALFFLTTLISFKKKNLLHLS